MIPRSMLTSRIRIIEALVWVACFSFGGALAALTLGALYFAAKSPFVKDSANKHGISSQGSSRLGGVVIFSSLLLYLSVSPWVDQELEGLLLKGQERLVVDYAFLAFVVALIGLADDLNEGLSPGFRMALLFGVVLFGLSLNVEWVPLQVFEKGIGFENLPIQVSILAAAFLLIGFVNAGNMVDGANGLLAGISTIWFYFTYELVGNYYFLACFLAVAVFTVHNVILGSVILGDFGSFGLSSLMVLSSFHAYQVVDVSAWCFASFLFYPCFEICRVILHRLVSRRSPLKADNLHFHNYLYRYVMKRGLNNLASNSVVGLSIAFLSSGIPLLVYALGALGLNDWQGWTTLFVLQTILFLAIWAICIRDERLL